MNHPAWKYRPVVALGDKCLLLYSRFEDKDACKSVPGGRWEPELKAWEYPLQPETLERLAKVFPGLNVEPEARLELAKITEGEVLAERMKAAGWEDTEPVEPMPIKTKPYQHQVAGYNLALHQPHHAMLYEQGCGKTLTAIAVTGRRFQKNEVRRVLVVAPASVVPVWPSEFALHADFPHEVLILQGPVKKRKKMLKEFAPEEECLQISVINYESTWRMFDELAAWQPDMIICDESQRIKTPGARQSKAMHKLGQRTKYRLILTGTPVTQGPLDFFSQYKFLNQKIFGRSYYAFRNRYAIMGGWENKQVVGYRNLPELVKKAHSIAFRVAKKDALDLPPVVEQELYCELEPKAAGLYRQLARESVAQIEGERTVTAAIVLTRLLRLSQLTGGFINDDDGNINVVSKAKMNLFKDTLDDILCAGKKVVVFARFIPEITAIRKHSEKERIGYSWIAGEVKQSERGEMVRRFQEDKDCRLFVAQTQTAGLGITLHAASIALFYSLDYSFANLDQARARIDRIGQTANKVTNIFLLAKDTVDEKVRKILAEKQDVARVVVDDWKRLFKDREGK